jgi:hypothetical protein
MGQEIKIPSDYKDWAFGEESGEQVNSKLGFYIFEGNR